MTGPVPALHGLTAPRRAPRPAAWTHVRLPRVIVVVVSFPARS